MSSIRTDMIDNYWISTAQISTSIQSYGEVYYYETMVWEWDYNNKLLGKICFQNNSGIFKNGARIEHERIVKVFRYLAYRKRRDFLKGDKL